MAALSWPGAATQGWMALGGIALGLTHWAYYSVWLRLPEWRLFLQETRGYRAGYADHDAIGRNRSWADEAKLEKNGPLTSLWLGLGAAALVWMWREVPADAEHWVSEAFKFGGAFFALLWPILVGEPGEVGAPPKEEQEPSGMLEQLIGKERAPLAHFAIAGTMFALAYWTAH